jgi:hypothetical protein
MGLVLAAVVAVVVSMVILSTENLPSAAEVQQIARSHGWTFPAGCLSW